MTYFYVDVISLNDLFDLGYINMPNKRFGDAHTLRSPQDSEVTIPYINIPNIVNGKRSLTAPECQGYYRWLTELVPAWRQKLHTTTLPDTLLGDSCGTYLLVPRIAIVSDQGIGSDGTPRLNEWIQVDKCSVSSVDPTLGPTYDVVSNANPAIDLVRWEDSHIDDYSNVFDGTYNETVGFRFKLID